MRTKKSLDRYTLADLYKNIKECECQGNMPSSINTDTTIKISTSNNNEEKVEMVLNNLVNINNKSAELIQCIQNALDSEEDIEHWVTEKIAVMANLIGTLTDYYIKYKELAPTQNVSNISSTMTTGGSTGSLKLEPMTVASSFPLNTNMPPMVTSF